MTVRTRRPSRVSTLRRRLQLATSEAILAAAEETLVERGFEATGISEISARAGVAVGTVYNHFQDREALLAALVDARGEELMQGIESALERSASAPVDAQITALATALLEHRKAHFRLAEIVFDDRTCPGAANRKRSASVLSRIHARVTQVMRRGISEGQLRREDPGLYASLFLGMIKGLFLLREAPAPGLPAGLARKLTRLFMEGASS